MRPGAPGNLATFAARMVDQTSSRSAALAARTSAGPPASRSWRGAERGMPPLCPRGGGGAAGLPASPVGERAVVEVRLGQDFLLLLELEQVGPRLAVAPPEEQVLRAHDVAGVEVLRVGERQQRH